MTAASDGVCIGRRIDLAAAACAARSASAVRSRARVPLGFSSRGGGDVGARHGRPARVRDRFNDGAARVRGVRHTQLTRVVQPPGRADGVVERLGRRRRGQQRDPAAAKKVGDVGDDLPDDLAGSAAGRVRPAPRAAAAATARDGVQVVEYHDGGRASGRRRRRRLHRGNSRPRVAGCGVGHRPARDVDDRRERALVVAEGPGDAPRDAAAPASRCAPEEDAARNITPGDRRQRRRESRRRLIRRLIRR